MSELPQLRRPGRAVTARASLRQLMEAERLVNQYPYPPFNGWQVYQAVGEARDFAERGKVPAWHFWAAFWDLAEPVATGETIDDLVTAVRARQEQMYAQLPLPLRNRRLLAEKENWPFGVVDDCEELEAQFPAWSVWWRPEVGYVAQLDVPMHRCELTAADRHELDVLMEQVPQHDYSVRGCAWCLARLEQRG
ncbi:hypothetical protein [Actinoplanes subtropicus]|uniref:hypothetical protein n=1 Tax=Actinoplanes subtropicus TaxID=543632 RepID=UPI0012F84CE0|nr:hypothetical protein [Actinoplanes subtropicus]